MAIAQEPGGGVGGEAQWSLFRHSAKSDLLYSSLVAIVQFNSTLSGRDTSNAKSCELLFELLLLLLPNLSSLISNLIS